MIYPPDLSPEAIERALRPVGPEAHREDLVERGGIAGRGRGRRRR